MTMACVAVFNAAADAPQVVPHRRRMMLFRADVAYALLEGQGSVQGDSEVPWFGAWRKGITTDVDDSSLQASLVFKWNGVVVVFASLRRRRHASSEKADEVLHGGVDWSTFTWSPLSS